jgi:hypothetical protein
LIKLINYYSVLLINQKTAQIKRWFLYAPVVGFEKLSKGIAGTTAATLLENIFKI